MSAHLPALGLADYWGYNPVAFLAPDPRLAPGGWAEVRARGGGAAGGGHRSAARCRAEPHRRVRRARADLSLRGLDNATYYRLDPGDPSRYRNDTGCGNTLALDRPAVRAARARCAARLGAARRGGRVPLRPRHHPRSPRGRLRSGGAAAGGDRPGPGAAPAGAHRRAVGCRTGDGYRLGAFPAAWGEWNDRYRDTVRRFWRGDPGQLARAGDAHRRLGRYLRRAAAAGLALGQFRRRARRLSPRRPRCLCRTSTTRPTANQTETGTTRIGPGTTASRARPTIPPSAPAAPPTCAHCLPPCCSRAARRCSGWATNAGAAKAATTTPMRRTTRSAGSTGKEWTPPCARSPQSCCGSDGAAGCSPATRRCAAPRWTQAACPTWPGAAATANPCKRQNGTIPKIKP